MGSFSRPVNGAGPSENYKRDYKEVINTNRALIFGLGSVVAFVSLQLAFFSVVPASFYFKYFDIEFDGVDEENNALVFYSDSERYRSVSYKWNDVLYCDTFDGRGFRNFSNQIASLKVNGPAPRKKRPWNYKASFPRGSDCYIHSTSANALPYNFRPSQVLITKVFYIPEKDEK